jgi:glycosyltransferase involved in cell wall biosynthesis
MRMSGVSGAENHLVELTAALSDCGWLSDALIPSPRPEKLGSYVKHLERVCQRVEVLTMRHDVSYRLLGRLARLLATNRYDVAHAHLIHADWHLAAASTTARQIPLVSSKHNPDPFRRSPMFRAVESVAIRRYSAVIAISKALSHFTQSWSKVSPVTIHYGLTTRAMSPPKRDWREVTRLIAVGRLEEQKGFDVAIRAMAQIRESAPNLQLVIAGEGSQRPRLTELIRHLDLESSVSLLGERRDVADLMREADIFVHPARWEGFGLVLLEAMREGLPVVASQAAAVPEIVEDGSTGILIPPDDPAALAAALLALVQDPPLGRKLGNAGFWRLKGRFSPERMARQTADVYESITNGLPPKT